VVELFQRLFVIAPVALEGDGEVFAGMGVMEGEGAGLVEGSGVADRSGSREEQHRRKTGAIASLKRAARFDLACEDSQHYIEAHPR
jgi:hypothetical protein